jgi:hypothetical protein
MSRQHITGISGMHTPGAEMLPRKRHLAAAMPPLAPGAAILGFSRLLAVGPCGRMSCVNMDISPISLVFQKILEDPRAYSTLFFHQEKVSKIFNVTAGRFAAECAN